jgi:hypothetical protein
VTLLSPWTAVLAAAVAVPLLLLLYFLKLRRRRMRMASTLLWHRAFTDHQVNVPFQRLRLSALFLLQLLLVAFIVVALGEPVIEGTSARASRIILLVDQSASMSAIDAPDRDGRPGPRLAAAKRAARDLLDRVASGRGPRAMMIIAFGARPRLITGFESRRAVLEDAIDSIEPTDEAADLQAALQLAGSYSRAGEEIEDEPPDVVLLSDGNVGAPDDPGGFGLRGGRFRFVRVGPGADAADGADADAGGAVALTPVPNVGVVSLSARRDHDDPARVLVFTRLTNVGPAPVETAVTLLVDGTPGPTRLVTIPPPSPEDDAPGQATATFAIDRARGAVIGVRHGVDDVLASDDTAAVVIPPPARPRIALVHAAEGPDPFLRELLLQSEPASLRSLGAAAWEAIDPADVDARRRFDLVVFDGVAPSRLPAVPTITFGAAPVGIEVTPPAGTGGARVLSWSREHPIMRYVSLDTLVYRSIGGLQLPVGATPLATGPGGTVIGLVPSRGARHVVVAFALAQSNWARHVSIAVFMQNAIERLTVGQSGRTSLAVRPGEPVTVHRRADAAAVIVRGPGGVTLTAREAAPGALVTLPTLRRAGLYAVEGAAPPHEQVAVSVLSDAESDARPRASLVVNARRREAGAVGSAAPRGIWAWLVAAALGFLVVEWLAYCRILQV